MCGIAGYFNCEEYQLNDEQGKFAEQWLDSALQAMKHRGPDNCNKVSLGKDGALGHRRLAIIDLSSEADQPFESTESILTFNGEIYNYRELRKDLELEGTRFTTESDTEVLQKLLDSKGMSALHMLNGMFAIAYWRKSEKVLYLIRDRFGVKPLYTHFMNGKILFASEVKAIYPALESPTLNIDVASTYLQVTAADYGTTTFIQGVNQVNAGSYVRISQTGMKSIEWYSWPRSRARMVPTRSDEDFEDLLVDALRLRIHSDVPVCMTLSGGLDSSTLYTLARERLDANLTLFTYDHKGQETSELDQVRRLTRKYGDQIFVIHGKEQDGFSRQSLKADALDTEFPIWGLSAHAYKAIYRAIKEQGFKVVIEGHGADEIFGGYPFMVRQMVVSHLRRGDVVSALRVTRFHDRMTFPSHHGSKKQARKLAGILASAAWLRGDVRSFDQVVHQTSNVQILPIVLRTFDRLSMKYSLESRAPYMDYRVIEMGLKMPLRQLSLIGSKSPMRQILNKYGNHEIGHNDAKLGFAADLKSAFESQTTRNELLYILRQTPLAEIFPNEFLHAQGSLQNRVMTDSEIYETSKIVQLALFSENLTFERGTHGY